MSVLSPVLSVLSSVLSVLAPVLFVLSPVQSVLSPVLSVLSSVLSVLSPVLFVLRINCFPFTLTLDSFLVTPSSHVSCTHMQTSLKITEIIIIIKYFYLLPKAKKHCLTNVACGFCSSLENILWALMIMMNKIIRSINKCYSKILIDHATSTLKEKKWYDY